MNPVQISESISPDTAAADVPNPDTLTITLKKPVSLGDQVYTELRLREPTGAEMIAVDGKRGWALDIALIALVSGVPAPAVEKIGGGDLARARKVLDHFFDTGRPTGAGAWSCSAACSANFPTRSPPGHGRC